MKTADKDLRGKAVSRNALGQAFDELLEPGRFDDYCPNGLQVEGRAQVRRLSSAVTASAAAIRGAAALGADALVVHHGFFWKGEDPCLTGTRIQRIRLLIEHGINLFAYHLPLDAHPDVGNNACLARVLDWAVDERVGTNGLLWMGRLARDATAASLGAHLRRRLGRAPLAVGALERPIRRVAWCTGAAQDLLEEAIAHGADAFVSGEISERTTHLAREAGVVYFAAGHHATERHGVQALGEAVAARLGIAHRFVEDDNPV